MSANLDPRQMRELPVNGRNWQDLIAVVPGARIRSQQRGDSIAAGTGTMQLNLDGQQVTQTISAGDRYGFGQPRFGQDAIAGSRVKCRTGSTRARAGRWAFR